MPGITSSRPPDHAYKYLSIFIILLVALFGHPMSSLGAEPGYPRSFHTEDNRIVDDQGQEVILRGVALGDPIWLAMGEDPDIGPWSEAIFSTARDWGASVMRLSIHPAVWRRYGMERSLGILEQATAWARQHGLYLIIDFHSIGFPPENDYMPLRDIVFGDLYRTTPTEILAFWRAVAERFAADPVIAFFELFNEPVRDSAHDYPADNSVQHWLTWRNFNEQLIDEIRVLAPNKPVMVGGLQFAYDLSYVPRFPVRRSNVVYATHVYPDASWKIDWDTAFGHVSDQFPVFMSEFGFGGSHPESDFNGTGQFRESIIRYVEERGIGWTAWAFSPAMEPQLLADENFAPSDYGAFIRSTLLEHSTP